MNTGVTWQTNSTSSERTEQLAEQLAATLKGGEVIELVSDLGGGKTTFVRGLARGLKSEDRVMSPTFTISRVYRTPGPEIHHFDFYRLAEPGIVAHELQEVLGDPSVVTVVEWADAVRGVLPPNRLTVTIAQTADGNRTLSFQCPMSQEYLLKGLV